MSLTPQDREWRDVYAKSTLEFQKAVNDMFTELWEAARSTNYRTASDDPSEALIAAITRYLVESGNAPGEVG